MFEILSDSLRFFNPKYQKAIKAFCKISDSNISLKTQLQLQTQTHLPVQIQQ